MTKGKKILFTACGTIILVFFLVAGLIYAKAFLAPLATAVILSLLMLPVARKLEHWGIKRVWSSLINVFFLLLLSLAFMWLIGLQIQSFISDWNKAKDRLMPKIEQLQNYLYKDTPLEKGELKKQLSQSKGSVGKKAMSFVTGIYSFLGDFLITLVYVFFLLNYRKKYRRFLLKLFPEEKHDEVNPVVFKAAELTKGYLYGKFILMILLAVLYAIGMGVTGVSNFIIISLLAALLSIIPYIGNIIAFAIALGLGYVTNGDTTALIGIVATFVIAQFVESYLFEPYIVGDRVNLDPFMTILAVVVGSILWGVVGMIIAIPILAMINVVFNNVVPLKPYSYLLSNNVEKENS